MAEGDGLGDGDGDRAGTGEGDGEGRSGMPPTVSAVSIGNRINTWRDASIAQCWQQGDVPAVTSGRRL